MIFLKTLEKYAASLYPAENAASVTVMPFFMNITAFLHLI